MGQENDSEDVRQKLVYHLLFQLAQQIASFAVFISTSSCSIK